MEEATVRTDLVNRDEQLLHWVESSAGGAGFNLHALPGGASTRRFFRLEFFSDSRRTLIVRDAAEPGDSHRFVRAARLLARAGVHVPDVIAQDLDQGFLIISDFGDASYLSTLNQRNADLLFEAAIHALLRLQLASQAGVLLPVDERLLRSEIELFTECYLRRHLGVRLASDERRGFDNIVAAITDRVLSQPRVYVHRDYTARNLMVCETVPGVLDFQDAMYGPITYDVASLFWSSTRDWPEERVRQWTIYYWEKAKAAGISVPDRFDDFREELDWTLLQRHLKVLGVFARLNYRDGKPEYLQNSPRLIQRIRKIASHRRELAPLLQILDRCGVG
ncbi:MAG TPA: phosphotransferase [Pyrinomonadaceae bacterium]|nr:phosphotransferase [Pyrinomonadaceae bacterium]